LRPAPTWRVWAATTGDSGHGGNGETAAGERSFARLDIFSSRIFVIFFEVVVQEMCSFLAVSAFVAGRKRGRRWMKIRQNHVCGQVPPVPFSVTGFLVTVSISVTDGIPMAADGCTRLQTVAVEPVRGRYG